MNKPGKGRTPIQAFEESILRLVNAKAKDECLLLIVQELFEEVRILEQIEEETELLAVARGKVAMRLLPQISPLSHSVRYELLETRTFLWATIYKAWIVCKDEAQEIIFARFIASFQGPLGDFELEKRLPLIIRNELGTGIVAAEARWKAVRFLENVQHRRGLMPNRLNYYTEDRRYIVRAVAKFLVNVVDLEDLVQFARTTHHRALGGTVTLSKLEKKS